MGRMHFLGPAFRLFLIFFFNTGSKSWVIQRINPVHAEVKLIRSFFVLYILMLT